MFQDTGKQKPTVIRPSQPPKVTGSTPSPPKQSSVQGSVATPPTQRKEPPKSLDVKNDPWNQIPKV